jgi:hypothetical protein
LGDGELEISCLEMVPKKITNMKNPRRAHTTSHKEKDRAWYFRGFIVCGLEAK